MKARLYTLLVYLFIRQAVFAQFADTLTFMTYNLMRYNATGIDCTPPTAADRNIYLKRILFDTKPDLCALVEVGNSVGTASLLQSAFDTLQFIKSYQFTPITLSGVDVLTSSLAFNTQKLSLLYSQPIRTCSPRWVWHHALQYRNPGDASETTAIHIIVAHLKAGSTNSDQEDRSACAQQITQYLDSIQVFDPIWLLGDLNVYSSTEATYQHLLVKFDDPINPTKQMQNWSNNPDFSSFHTQSPRLENTGSCFAFGGLDDRFDFILDNTKNSNKGISCIANSYQAYGNDGTNFNQSIWKNTNNPLQEALHEMSDHIPVLARYRIELQFNPRYEKIAAERCGASAYIDFGSVSICGANLSIVGIQTPISQAGVVVRCYNALFLGNSTHCGNGISLYSMNQGNLVQPPTHCEAGSGYVRIQQNLFCASAFTSSEIIAPGDTLDCSNYTLSGTGALKCPNNVSLEPIQSTMHSKKDHPNLQIRYLNNQGYEIILSEPFHVASQLQLYDALGRMVFEATPVADSNYLLVPNLGSGMYFYTLWKNNQLVTRGKLYFASN